MTTQLVPWNAPTAGKPVNTDVHLPGSKSITARALVIAAASVGPSTLLAPLRARDTELMAAGLRAMGMHVSTMDDERWELRPRPLRGPAEINAGLAGTVMRFLPPLAALANGPVTFDGDEYARKRPMGPLLKALRELGVSRIDASETDGMPFTIFGEGRLRGGEVVVNASASSQLVSGLLLAGADYDEGITVRHVGPPVPSAPHLKMTVQMLRSVGAAVDDSVTDVWQVAPGRLMGRAWQIEPDLSGAVPFFAAALVTGGRVTLTGWPSQSVQPVERVRELLTAMGGKVIRDEAGLTVSGTGKISGIDVSLNDVGELTPAFAALAVLADGPSTIRGVASIRNHETDRISALARELSTLGAEVIEHPDGLTITPKKLTGGVFQTYADHRMAHAAAIIGLRVAGISVDDISCTSKTLPSFPRLWEAMAGNAEAKTEG